ncbi:putative ABC transporter substrate-binding protein [Actinoplanes missouriensis 431]|uniref:Putative ABC transporter substrate-binding protein n=1 Tax=Actinoplanes missouriensis (strain ATCC 14538 / DSM 43046 / CBS 188.64 / JCM 3121 / NBRC 102363 / NCIMB 12654 / NRRL B-3342 / UNCC 431) TaxID=512565 RepID=I0H5A9_ACTM4|nr:extracellular solute-binding protein [Actinoplanes missouriensis]BAL88196.1 putative ABC transporter substrate-binding protein [Actinoplanes missouriensis 431]
MKPVSAFKIVAAVSAVALVAAGCSGGDKEAAPAAKMDGDKVVISVLSPADSDTKLDTNAITTMLSDKYKIKFQFQTTNMDGGPAKEKRQIAISSGDYPDLFMLIPWVDAFTKTEVQKLGQQGVAVPLEDLIKEHAPNIQKALDSNSVLKAMSTAPDGHIYALPQWSDCYHCSYPNKLWMNSDWLKKLNLQMPKTTEDLRTVLKAFKTQDPNGNGKADEIPMTTDPRDSTLLGYLMGGFAYAPYGAQNGVPSLLALNGNQVVTPVDKPEWREGLKYINSLYKDGLIDPASFTQNTEALQTLGNNPSAVQVGSVPVLWPGIFVQLGSKDGRDKQYDAVPPLTGPQGKSYTGYNNPTSVGYTFMLTNKSSKEARVAALKMLDYIYTDEGQIIVNAGPEGVGWEKPKAGDVALDESTQATWKPRLSADVPKNSSWNSLGQYNFTLALRNAQAVPKDIYAETGLERRLFEATKQYEPHVDKAQVFPEAEVWADPATVSELSTLKTNLDSYVSQGQLAFITGTKNIDTEWDAWVQGLDGIGMKRYLELNQQAYDKKK